MNYAAQPLTAQEAKFGKGLAILTLFAVGYLFSLWYLDAYYLGDQKFYAQFYYSLYQTPFDSWARQQEVYLGSSEPLYRYVIGVAARADVDRIAYLSLWNALFIAGIGNLLIQYRSSLLFAGLLLTNYYVLVLLGPAERLKFAYICLIFIFAVKDIRYRAALSALSIFFHTQALVQFASAGAYYVIDNRRAIVESPMKLLLLIGAGATALGLLLYVFFFLLGSTILLKIDVYSNESEGLLEAAQWVMLLIGGLFVFEKRIPYFFGMLPMGVLTILFGNRVNVATLVLFATLAITQGRTRHPLVLVVMLYMSVKSIPFIIDVMKYGTGY